MSAYLKKTFFVSLLLLMLSLGVKSAFAYEKITAFDSNIVVNKDTSISINESIKYTTDLDKHGIYRYIPLRYTRNGINYTNDIKNVQITDEKGIDIPFTSSRESGNLMLKIGDPDRTFTGNKTYLISYQVSDALSLIDNKEANKQSIELYWDITGEGWQIEIASSSAHIESPSANIIRTACYSGAFGGDDGLCQQKLTSSSKADFIYSSPISYGDNFTVALEFDPQGQIVFPSQFQKGLKKFLDNILLFPLLLPGIVMFIWWWQNGRDKSFLSWNVFNHDENRPQQFASIFSARNIPMVYEPIKELTPGEAGAIVDEKVDIQDIIAEIIDLARQKCLSIERIEKKKLLGKETDYLLKRLDTTNITLLEHQQYLLDSLFGKKTEVKLSELKGKFYSHISKLKRLIFQSLVKKGLFAANPENTRNSAMIKAVVMIFVAAILCKYLIDQEIYWSILFTAVSAVFAIFFAYNMPAKTAKGYNFFWQAKGLRKSIKYGEWREKIKEKHLFCEEVLPFAIALGVVKQLSKDMSDLSIQPPDYLSANTIHNWNTASFVHSFTSQASTNLTFNPSSSSHGGSGFSGGFSGGGGGGGGGGSW